MKNTKPRKDSSSRPGLSYSIGFACFVFSIFITLAQAAENLAGPQKIIQSTSDTLQQNLGKEPLKGDFSKAYQFVDEVLTPHIDMYRISYLALGKHWKRANEQQKQRFQREFKTLIMRTYTRTFLEYADWSIRYMPLRMQPDDTKIIVKTEVMQEGALPLPVDYRLKQNKGHWQVYDVITDGVSLVTNYRSSFKNEIARGGSIDTVITRLAERNREALAANGA